MHAMTTMMMMLPLVFVCHSFWDLCFPLRQSDIFNANLH